MGRSRSRSPFHREVEDLERALQYVRDAEPAAQPLHFALPSIIEDDVNAVSEVLRTGWLNTGSACRGLEEDLAEHLGARYVVAVSSGTAAIEIALRCLNLPRGARVGIPT